MNIILVGAGPRNLTLTERLLSHAKKVSSPVNITLYDPFPIGGRVWNPEQSPIFLMNTVTQQLTLFTDSTVPNRASALYGPNFYEWATTQAIPFIQNRYYTNEAAFLDELTRINPNRFASRALFGVYTQWFFDNLGNHLPSNVTLSYERKQVLDIVQETGNQFKVLLDDQKTVFADQVVMTLGNTDTALTAEQIQFAKAATSHDHLLYLASTHPDEAPLEQVPANEPVILRGLGLSFFDYIAKLSIGREGQFARDADDLLYYIPSGNEPKIIAGSRSGMPMHARGVNQKFRAQSYKPFFFTTENLDRLAARNNQTLTYDHFFTVLKKEIEFKHYQNTINDLAITLPFNAYNFIEALKQSSDLNQTARQFGLPEAAIVDWDRLLKPMAEKSQQENYTDFMLNYLTWDITDAYKGNDDAPYAGAFDILRDVRGVIRHYLDQGYLSGDEYAKFLDQFNPFNSIISVGPPVLRVEQMRALIRANILTITGPGLNVTNQDNHYLATDDLGQTWQANTLVEARLSPVSLTHSINPLLAALRERGILSAGMFNKADGSKLIVGGARMNKKTFNVINIANDDVTGLYIWGVPTEGWSWFTTFAPRPGVNDKNLRDADRIASAIFSNH